VEESNGPVPLLDVADRYSYYIKVDVGHLHNNHNSRHDATLLLPC